MTLNELRVGSLCNCVNLIVSLHSVCAASSKSSFTLRCPLLVFRCWQVTLVLIFNLGFLFYPSLFSPCCCLQPLPLPLSLVFQFYPCPFKFLVRNFMILIVYSTCITFIITWYFIFEIWRTKIYFLSCLLSLVLLALQLNDRPIWPFQVLLDAKPQHFLLSKTHTYASFPWPFEVLFVNFLNEAFIWHITNMFKPDCSLLATTNCRVERPANHIETLTEIWISCNNN